MPLWKHNGNGIFSVKIAYKRGLHVTNTNTQYKWNDFYKKTFLPKLSASLDWLSKGPA